MSRFQNIDTLISCTENLDIPRLEELFTEAAKEGELHLLADDVIYIITRLLAMFSDRERGRIVNMFRTEITDFEIQELELNVD